MFMFIKKSSILICIVLYLHIVRIAHPRGSQDRGDLEMSTHPHKQTTAEQNATIDGLLGRYTKPDEVPELDQKARAELFGWPWPPNSKKQ